ncbi:hypothetical protein Gasu2_68370 [Galdieria sulphuraria]|nr:hypothetical protein Gasu2_68370 [Galdieria sulphuraria]
MDNVVSYATIKYNLILLRNVCFPWLDDQVISKHCAVWWFLYIPNEKQKGSEQELADVESPFETNAVFFFVYELLSKRLRTTRLFHSLLLACFAFGVFWLFAANISYCQSLQSPELLVDSASHLIQVKDTVIHFKQYIPINKDVTWGLVLLHGFGSWLYTYHALWGAYGKQLDCALIGFDRPAFGFSSRPRNMEYYSQHFAVYLVHFFMDRLSQLGISNHVIVGHSMGGLTAALASLKYPQRVKALILIAAAIPINPPSSKSNDSGSVESSTGRMDSVHVVVWKSLHWVGLLVVTLIRIFRNGLIRIFVRLAALVIQPVMYFSLSLLVSQEMFWKRGLAMAWYSIEKLTDKVIEQYRLPTLVKDWQRGFIKFVFANRNKTPFYSSSSLEEQDIVDQLSKSNIPILLIHGKEDRIIPLERSLQLAANIPQARLVTIPHCGHVPQEEQPERVYNVIRQFLYSIENERIVVSDILE